jgi:hypothetical protein
MNQFFEKLLPQIQEYGSRFAERITGANPSLKYAFGSLSNEVFLLKFYGGFRLDDNGDEIAVTVEAVRSGQAILLESDICMDNGLVLKVGPAAQFSSTSSPEILDTEISRWMQEFEAFLLSAEQPMLQAARTLDR